MGNDVPTEDYGQGEETDAALSRAASRGDQAGNDAIDNYFLDGDPLDKSSGEFWSAAGTDAKDHLLNGAVDAAEEGAIQVATGAASYVVLKGAEKGFKLGAEAWDARRDMTALDRARKSNWTKSDGSIWWPENDGFDGPPAAVEIQPGSLIDRYGKPTGHFVAPAGTPFPQRSMLPGSDVYPPSVYRVVRPVEALGGVTAPWFGQPGGGVQFRLNNTVEYLLDNKFIEEVR